MEMKKFGRSLRPPRSATEGSVSVPYTDDYQRQRCRFHISEPPVTWFLDMFKFLPPTHKLIRNAESTRQGAGERRKPLS